MQQQTGHYAGYIPRSSSSDSPYVYPNMASYGSAPPYTPSPPSHYPENAYQAPPQPPPQYIPSHPSLAESMASLSISPQGSYVPAPTSAPPAAAQSSYAPSVPSYDQSYAALASMNQQSSLHHQSTTSQPPNYDLAGFPGAMPSPLPQSGYDPSLGSLMGSYSTQQQTSYDLSSLGSCEATVQQGTQFPASTASYGPSLSGVASYGAHKHGMQGYDHTGSSLGQSQTGVVDQGSQLYGGAQQGREFERPFYSQSSSYESSYYEKPISHDRGPAKGGYDFDDMALGDVYAYDGGNTIPYGARGTGTGGSWGSIDRLSSFSNSQSLYGNTGSSKLPKAVPKAEPEDKSSGVQKYRVKMISDASSGPQDVLCQIGLDGVRMISPSTSKTVRIYPLETITRWEVSEPSVFTFWAKSAVDIEPRRIRLQSGHYTTNAILDTLTAACVQFSEMVGKDGTLDSSKASVENDKKLDMALEKKRVNLANWITLKNRQSAPEEKQHWVPDEAVTKCYACSSDFGAFLRRHHCRNCGDVFCDKCTSGRTALTVDEDAPIVRVCDHCLAEVTQRLSNAKDISKKPCPAPRSHEDLAKKLQEEMERNSSRRSTTTTSNPAGKERSGGQTTVLNCSGCGSISLVSGTTCCPTCGVDSNSGNSSSKGTVHSSYSSGKRMREVACPTCTVHLQVQVPSSGTETVECGVCQHPFLVSAH